MMTQEEYMDVMAMKRQGLRLERIRRSSQLVDAGPSSPIMTEHRVLLDDLCQLLGEKGFRYVGAEQAPPPVAADG